MNTIVKQFRDKANTQSMINASLWTISRLEKKNVLSPGRLVELKHPLTSMASVMDSARTSKAHLDNYTQAAWYSKFLEGLEYLLRFKSHLEHEDFLLAFPDEKDQASIKDDIARFEKSFMTRPVIGKVTWDAYLMEFHALTKRDLEVGTAITKASYAKEARLLKVLRERVVGATPSAEEKAGFDVLMRRHDFYYDYSDDNSVWRRGNQERSEIMTIVKSHPTFSAMWDAFCETKR